MKKNARVLFILLFLVFAAAISVTVPVKVIAENPPGVFYITSGGWYNIGGKLRYFHSPGEMAADEWLLHDGNWYYIKPGSIMAAGEILNIGGIIYAFDYKGVCVLDTDEKIWWFFMSKGISEYAVAGIMGNLYAESLLNPQNLQDSYEKQLDLSDCSYTLAVDNGTYSGFINDCAGYGLAQWTSPSRKKKLLAFARNTGVSIGDIDLQLAFIWEELCGSYSDTLSALKNAGSIREASDIFITKYERPANQSDAVKSQRASFGKAYYEKFTVSAFNAYFGN